MDLKNLSALQLQDLTDQLSGQLSPLGLELYPFKIKWYNALVSAKYRLEFDERCIGFVIISTPDMFENAFIPYIRKHWTDGNSKSDPIDECMKYHFSGLKSKFSDHSIEVIHDFDVVYPHRRPRVLVQTAAHVSGAAFYYKPDPKSQQNGKPVKQMGVCIHPVFGGWFAIRGVLIFRCLTSDSLIQKLPKDVIPGDDNKQNLLIQFSNWSDWRYRDAIPVTKRYSDLQIKYFALKPSERKALVNQMVSQN